MSAAHASEALLRARQRGMGAQADALIEEYLRLTDARIDFIGRAKDALAAEGLDSAEVVREMVPWRDRDLKALGDSLMKLVEGECG